MLVISGIGEISENGYSYLFSGITRRYADMKDLHLLLHKEGTLSEKIKNYGRFDVQSKKTCCAVAVALKDAGIIIGENILPENIGIVNTSKEGSLFSNMNYFKDYVTSGRKISRGNMFIYTLPSSPVSEAAIYFGITGPVTYVGTNTDDIAPVMKYAGYLLDGRTTRMLILVTSYGENVTAMVISEQHDTVNDHFFPLDKARELTKITNTQTWEA